MFLKRIRFVLEGWGVRLGLLIVPSLPRRAVPALAKVMGHTAYGLSRKLRRVGMANLDLAFGNTRTRREKRQILRAAFGSFALAMLDVLWFSRHTRERIKEYVRFDPAFRAAFEPGPEICVSAHMGNWEILGMAFRQEGRPLVSVAAPLQNPGVDRLFNRLRGLTGQEVQSKYGAARPLLRALKAGQAVALLLDQNTKPVEGGVFVEFFGRPAPISSLAGSLAVRTGARIIIVTCLPQRDGAYYVPPFRRISLHDDGGLSAEERALRITQDIAHGIEELVRAHPEHWLWMYLRWKYIAPGQSASDYPYYARPLAEGRSTPSRKKPRASPAGTRERTLNAPG